MFALMVNDAFTVTDRGTVIFGQYKKSDNAGISANDFLYDFCGNKYLVKGFFVPKPPESERNIGLCIDTCGKSKDYFIGKLLTDRCCTEFLFPQDPFDRKKPDFDFAEEFKTAENMGFASALLDVDTLKVKVKDTDIAVHTLYRGWMLTPENYRKLYDDMARKFHFLVNTSEQYSYCHLIPEWYEDLKDVTPFTVYSEDISDSAILEMLKKFGDKAVIVKDYVKSRKHEWYEACYIPKASDTKAAMAVIHTFIERQAENLVGGIVLREYVDLQFTGYHPESGIKLSAEYRAFFLCGRLVSLIDYWQTGKTEYSLSKEETERLCSLAGRVKSNFFTVDIARRSDGKLIVMELGDGQVSGLQGFGEEKFYSELALGMV